MERARKKGRILIVDYVLKNQKVEIEKIYAMVAGKNSISFSKLDFVIKDNKPPKKKEKGGKLSGRDYASLQKMLEKRTDFIEKIRTKNPKKATILEDKIKWDTAMKRAQGKKVKDNLVLVSKALKRKGKAKDKRKKKWDERVEKVKQDKGKKQSKRETNIAKRRDQKVKKKMDRARKKGRIV
ncbi:Surfeit locus protein 6 containing protein [Aphelenchoides bicaudatus]|nr:Surfeit locus protein 6 containing protein [Aphelenchoides bicaudatus]